jgi:carboxylesterase
VTSPAAHPVLPGAEPFSSEGGAEGVLVLHGFTGSPQSVGPLARAFADAGFTVELPLLPGHGTSLADLMRTDWSDWSAAAETAYTKLAGRCDSVVVAGLSMGATLAVWLAAHHPEIAGLVVVNAAVEPLDPSLVDVLNEMRSQGAATMPGIASDVADPNETELAYPELPIDGLLSLNEAWTRLGEQMAGLAVPALVMNSPQDHVVAPSNSDTLAAALAGAVERVTLERSYHVATIDYDRDLIAERAVAFARRVTQASSS